MSAANELNAALLIEVPKRFPGARVWRSNRVNATAENRDGSKRYIKAGIDGQGDLSGIFPVLVGEVKMGLRLEIETKTVNDSIRATQKAFKKMILDAGGIYIEARSVEQCLEDLGRWA